MLHFLQIMGLSLVTMSSVPTAPAETRFTNQDARGGAGLQVVVDPVTGQIVDNPTDAELETLAEGVVDERRRSSWELREFWLPSGGRGVYLDGWADHSLSVELAPDGEVQFVCSQGDEHHPPSGAATDGEDWSER